MRTREINYSVRFMEILIRGDKDSFERQVSESINKKSDVGKKTTLRMCSLWRALLITVPWLFCVQILFAFKGVV